MEELDIKKKYTGIGGWLYLLCFLLIFGSPIRNIFTIYTEFAETSSYFKEIKGLENFVYIESVSILILMLLSVWAGISLVLIKPYAVKITKIYLILFLINGLIQNLFPQFAGIDAEFIKGMEHQMKVNTISSILVFVIWFTYLSVSERVKETYPKLKAIDIPNIKNKRSNNFYNKLSISINVIRNSFVNQIIKIIKNVNLKKLSSDEIIIISIITGTLFALIFGFTFGETYYYIKSGIRVNEEIYIELNQDYNHYKIFYFNYLIGISFFIIFGGITYIYLNRKRK